MWNLLRVAGLKFHPLKYSAPYPEEICLKRSDSGGRYFEIVFEARPCLCDVIPLTGNWREGQKPATDVASFAKLAKSIIYQTIINFTIFNVIISI